MPVQKQTEPLFVLKSSRQKFETIKMNRFIYLFI